MMQIANSSPTLRHARVALVAALGAGALLAASTAANAGILTAEWKFDDGSGLTAVDSVGGFNGGLGGSVAFSGSGKIDGSISFSGGNVIVGDNAALRPANNISVSAWINSTDSGNFRGVWDKIFNSVGFVLDVTGGFPRVTADAISLPGTTVITDGNWHLVVGTYATGVGSKIYVDGVLEGTDGTTTYTPHTTSLAMGGDNASTFLFSGSLDDASMWTATLTAGQAGAIYSLASDATLNYNSGEADQLFSLHTAGSGSTIVDGRAWNYASSLNGGVGTLVDLGNGGYQLQLSPDGSGVQTPEPASLALLSAGLLLVARRTKRA
jgi:hypothetical protein